jgi:hypothetical protein
MMNLRNLKTEKLWALREKQDLLGRPNQKLVAALDAELERRGF